MEQVAFRRLRKLRISDVGFSIPFTNCASVASCNKYGLIFLAVDNGISLIWSDFCLVCDLFMRISGFVVINSSTVHDAVISTKDEANLELTDFSCIRFSLEQKPLALEVNADSNILAVCLKKGSNVFALLYRTSIFGQPVPYFIFYDYFNSWRTLL